MLFNSKDGKYKIVDSFDRKSDIVLEHLIYIYLFRDTTNDLIHWCKEIHACIHRVAKFKGSKQLDYKTLNKWFLEDYLESVEISLNGDVETACYNEQCEIPEYNRQRLFNFVESYLEWLFKQLGDKGYVSLTEVVNTINVLLSK